MHQSSLVDCKSSLLFRAVSVSGDLSLRLKLRVRVPTSARVVTTTGLATSPLHNLHQALLLKTRGTTHTHLSHITQSLLRIQFSSPLLVPILIRDRESLYALSSEVAAQNILAKTAARTCELLSNACSLAFLCPNNSDLSLSATAPPKSLQLRVSASFGLSRCPAEKM